MIKSAELITPSTYAVATPMLGRQACERFSKLSVLMPVYNERLTVEAIVERVLAASIKLDIELVVVDDGSTDGSWEVLQRLAKSDARIVAIRHPTNRGKGAAVRTAIERLTGEVAIIQDADLEYDPRDYQRLLTPILQGQADAVFGSRFTGDSRRALFFWHGLANRMLTLLSNMVNDINLTDMETCYKMIRADTLRHLRLTADTFNIEPEITSRLVQWGARIYEVPISYNGRTYEEGKKIGALDAFRACWQIFRTGMFDREFTEHSGFYILRAVEKADRYNRYLIKKLRPFLGDRLLEAGAGIGNLSKFLLHRSRLVLTDYEPLYVARLRERFGHLKHLKIMEGDLTSNNTYNTLSRESLDTILCSNVLEHIRDDRYVLERFHETVVPGGQCIIIVPAVPGLYTQVDAELGHYLRYNKEQLCQRMRAAGFEIVHTEQFNRLGTLGWYFSGKIMRRKRLSPRQMIWFDRLLWLARAMESVTCIPGMSLIAVGRKM